MYKVPGHVTVEGTFNFVLFHQVSDLLKSQNCRFVNLLETLTAKPKVVGSIPTQNKYLCDEHEICSVSSLGVIYLYKFM